MLFNSFEFIFLFLPLVLTGYYFFGKSLGHRWAIGWIILGSLFFYSWWIPQYCPLIIASMTFNYLVGTAINSASQLFKKRFLLCVGLLVDLGLLGYYKYAAFGMGVLNQITNGFVGELPHEIILPLGISFFSFQQIGYLVDSFRGETSSYNFLDYCAFICFFPQWIAGPIVLHKEIVPEFAKKDLVQIRWRNIALGLSFFVMGLSKKVLLADNLSLIVKPAFSSAHVGNPLTFFEAWGGLMAYTFQIYFDFSGYCDMAIGLGLFFNIRLPLNFFSPYKQISIIDFWHTWHMTLSRFLKNYLYIPLGGNRRGPARRYLNLLLVMLLGGLWHGAGWTFVIWGGLHGCYLIVNHLWRGAEFGQLCSKFIGIYFYWAITLLCVMLAWVFFRSEDVTSALFYLKSLVGAHGFSLPSGFLGGGEYFLPKNWVGSMDQPVFSFKKMVFWVSLAGIFSLVPNNFYLMTKQFDPAIFSNEGNAKSSFLKISWQPNLVWAVVIGLLAVFSIMNLSNPSEFLYFQF
jgi:alginate O-acetyltransferase complex protein AlgI